jgi:O-antigen/teichoic acid export membrane protein
MIRAPDRLPRRGAALLEQVGVSGANFVAFLLFARHLAPEAWGEFGFAYALVLFLQGFQRALVTIPMIPFTAGPPGWDASRSVWAGANASLAWVAAGLLLAAAGAAALLAPPWWPRSLLMAALMALPVWVHEFARRAAVQEARFDLLAGMGAAYALPVLAAALLLPRAAAPSLHAALPAAAVVLGALGAALLYRVRSGRALGWRPGLPPRQAGYADYSSWALLSHLGYSGYNFGVQAILAALAGPAAVGVFHACRTLVQPLATLTTAMDSIDKPRAAAALVAGGPRAMRRVLARSMCRVAALALPFLAVVALGADTWLALAYREQYAGQAAVVALWCVVTLCSLGSQPVESGLYVARRTRALFFGRAVAALASLASAVPLISAYGTAGALGAMALGFALAAVFGAFSLTRLPQQP